MKTEDNIMRKKILLVRVPEVEFNPGVRDLRNTSIASLTVPMGITYLASVIKEDNKHDVQILDLYANHYEELVETLKTEPSKVLTLTTGSLTKALDDYKPDIVGFSAPFSFQHLLVQELIQATKHHRPNIRIYLGGYPTIFPEMVLNSIPALDVLFIGESENTILKVLEAELTSSDLRLIKGIAARTADEIYISHELNTPADIDSIPFPAYDMLPLEIYKSINGQVELPFMTSRGCPFACNYCTGHLYSGRKLRLRSLENLMAEIEIMHSKYNIDFLWIRDDNLNVNKKHVKQFLEEMIKRSLTIPWCDTNSFHVNNVDEELLDLCKASGCIEVIFAVESGSPRVLKDIMNKDVNLEHAKKMAKYCREIDLPLQCYFVVGNPGETKEEIQKTVECALELQVDHCTFSIATPFPGTQYYDVALKEGYLVHDPAYILGMKYMEANMQTNQFSSEQLKDLQYDANMRVNFLQNNMLKGDTKTLEEAFNKFSRISHQYQFHAVAHLLKGYLEGVLGDKDSRHKTYLHIKEMLKDDEIEKAYGKYFYTWDTPVTNDYKEWVKENNL